MREKLEGTNGSESKCQEIRANRSAARKVNKLGASRFGTNNVCVGDMRWLELGLRGRGNFPAGRAAVCVKKYSWILNRIASRVCVCVLHVVCGINFFSRCFCWERDTTCTPTHTDADVAQCCRTVRMETLGVLHLHWRIVSANYISPDLPACVVGRSSAPLSEYECLRRNLSALIRTEIKTILQARARRSPKHPPQHAHGNTHAHSDGLRRFCLLIFSFKFKMHRGQQVAWRREFRLIRI